jgi:hypothetical protein
VRKIEAVEAIDDPMPERSEHELSIYRGQAQQDPIALRTL